jgi:uncharacterized membrane-anchored protein YjiN (DUF445 family)
MAQATGLVVRDDGAALAKMKLVATLVLVAAAIVFVLTFFVGQGGTVALFVRAAAEAGMVGGLADWFAVTALFRHPMGLRIPHTALIPRKKDELAGTLGSFVTGNFLTSETVRSHVAEAGLVAKLADWLATEANARRAAALVASAAADALRSLSPQSVAKFALEFADLSIRQSSPTQELGRVLGDWVADKRHDSLTESVLRQVQVQGKKHRDELADKLLRWVEDLGFIAYLAITPTSSKKRVDSAIKELADAERDPEHVLRLMTDRLLADLATDLATNPATSERLDESLRGWLEKNETHAQTERLATELMDGIVLALRDDQSPTVKRLTLMILELAQKLQADPQLREDIGQKVASGIADLVQRYGSQLTTLIQKTVQGWSGDFASRRIELAAGKDLQFIRINGAVVGALAGVAIHGVSLLL